MKTKILRRATALLLLVCMAVSMAACGGQGGQETTEGKIAYAVEVKSKSGAALAGVGVYIYQDSTQQELVWFDKTDDSGRMTFEEAAGDGYVAVLGNVPDGYEAEAFYPLTGETTQIVLEDSSEPGDLSNAAYKLGDKMLEFTVTAVDGTAYSLSELLAGKKAVVLNFWFMSCEPCKVEFPYLQRAYEKFSDQIALLALNPVDSDADAVAQFASENELTFPVAACDPAWESAMQITGYPTTVVIDRYGTISLIHRGSIPDEQTFANVFAYFSDENYEAGTVKNVESLPQYQLPDDPEVTEPSTDPDVTDPTTAPTEPNPTDPVPTDPQPTDPKPTEPSEPQLDTTEDEVIEVFRSMSTDVTVKPWKVVYCNWYMNTDMVLTIKDPDACVIYDGKTYDAKNGKVSLTVKSNGTYSPVKIGIGNKGSSEKTFTATLTNIPGTWDNPYTLKLGEFEVNVASGNEVGVYYDYVATESGTLTIQCLSVTAGVDYTYSLQLMDSSNTIQEKLPDGVNKDPSAGEVKVSIAVKKGQKVRLCVSALPDENNQYPKAKFKLLATFDAG